MIMALLPSSVAVAQYQPGDCIKITKLSSSPYDSVTVISVHDSCQGRTDTIYVNGTALTNGSTVLQAPSDSSIVFRFTKGAVIWVASIDTTEADTMNFGGFTFITPLRYDTSYTKVTMPDTIRFVGASVDSLFTDHSDTPSSYTGQAGKVVTVNSGETGLEFTNKTNDTNDSLFVELLDTPSSYTGEAGKYVAVKATEDGLEFVSVPSGGNQVIGYSNFGGSPVDSTADAVWLYGDVGILISHYYNATGDSIIYLFGPDWDVHRDSVLTWIAAYMDTTSTGGGASTFLDLTDTPSTYSGKSGQVPFVNGAEDALEFGTLTLNGDAAAYDTTGAAVDSLTKVIRMEWMPAVDVSWQIAATDSTITGLKNRFGVVRYRLYLSSGDEYVRSGNGYHGWYVQLSYDSTNGCYPRGARMESFSWSAQEYGSSAVDGTVYSFYTISFRAGSIGVGAQYGYSSTSSYIALRSEGQMDVSHFQSINGRPSYGWAGFIIQTAGTSSKQVAGIVDLYLYYGQDHGHQTDYGVRVESVNWRENNN
jgi:hypothetical protein